LGGRWYGVRGRRFVRPTLTARVGGEDHRSLAVLDHKPWSADDGELWLAAFPLERDGAELTSVELAVAPDIAVPLPALRDGVPAAKPEGDSRSGRRAGPSAEIASPRPQVKAPDRSLTGPRSRRSALQAELDEARAAKAQA